MTYIKHFINIIVFLFSITNSICYAQDVQLLCERHRTEWNWIEYRISLENTSAIPILNPEIHYYASDKGVSAAIDYVSHYYSVTPKFSSTSNMTDLKLSVAGLLYPGNKVNIHFRIFTNWSAHDFSKDWSYPKNANITEPNYFMTVYDASHKILWGADPFNGNYNTGDVITWTDRGINSTITRYNGSNEALPAGRFWLFKDTPLSPKERDLLAQRGISKLSIGRSRGKIVAVFKSDSLVRKKTLDSLIAGFYNAIPVADTESVTIDLTDEDLYTEKSVCNAGQCHKEVELRPEFNMEISCWNDVDVNNCVSTIRNCGGQDIGVARGFIVATIAKDSLQCLSKNRDIEALNVQREMQPLMSTGRAGINVHELQDSEEWRNALAKERADLDWLKDAEYTGEGILVGVYESGAIDFDHPAFNEYDSSGNKHPRLMQKNEFFGIGDYDKKYKALKQSIKLKNEEGTKQDTLSDNHSTVVSGIIGGNGNNSPNLEYRGVAPKVHFYLSTGNQGVYSNQIGHVVNHSHITDKKALYSSHDYVFDKATFSNWKSSCTQLTPNPNHPNSNCIEGDSLIKTVVFGAGNNGTDHQYGLHRSYHSILVPAKNPIVAGMISAIEKIRAPASSMGPTWDGRIKPDVMAPGFSSLFKADEGNPFEAKINYIKLYRMGAPTPYISIDSQTNLFEIEHSATTPSNACQKEENFLHCQINHHPTQTNPPLQEMYISWKLPHKIEILPTDKIEVNYKIYKVPKDIELIYGTLWLGTCNLDTNNICNPKFEAKDAQFLPWHVSNKIDTTTRITTRLPSNIESDILRIDFDFSKGLTTPDICHGDSCGYITFSDGGSSAAAPFVSGLSALMYQKFKKETGDPLDKHSMRNSTVKSLLIHTAVDMEDSEDAHIACNADLTLAHNDGECHFTPYGKGPDFATGWGYVDGKAALNLISDYNKKTKEFPKFKEIEIGNSIEKRWVINVDTARSYLRTTLVWDDAPGERSTAIDSKNNKELKLINDLDMYIISPSGKYYYPWRLDTLPTEYIDSITGKKIDYAHIDSRTKKIIDNAQGFENIHDSDAVKNAYNDCSFTNKLDYDCFDHINNVEVVDVENPELGKWQIVVFGRSVTEFNNASDNAQVASLVSDLPLKEGDKSNTINNCKVTSGYAPQTDYSCTYKLGNDLVYYVSFHDSTSIGSGDDIVLTNAEGKIIGIYVGSELAGKTIKLKSSKLTVTLHSDNDNSQGWGFDITKIQPVNHAILKMPFEAVKKKRRNP